MLWPLTTMSRMISPVPVTARPTRIVRPTMRPERLRIAETRWSVRSMPARLSSPNWPTLFATWSRSDADTG